MIRNRLFALFALAVLCVAPVSAQQRPLVTMGGQTRQLPPGATLGVNAGTVGAASISVPPGVAPSSPNNGDCWSTTAGWSCRVNGTSVVVPVQAATNSALTAMSSTLGTVVRYGYTAAGDTPPALYTASGSACSLNGGAGDGGSQVPTSNGNCWILSTSATGIDVRLFGARCDATTDDQVAIQRALTFAGTVLPARVVLPGTNKCRVNSAVTIPTAVTLEGVNTYNSGLVAGVANINPMIIVDGDAVQIKNMYLDGIAPGVPTSGVLVQTQVPRRRLTIRDVEIHGTCTALDLSGDYHNIENVYIDSAGGSSCDVIQVGRLTTNALSTGQKFDRVTVVGDPSNRPRSCITIFDSGGMFFSHSDMQICGIGTRIFPGTNQWVAWATFHDIYVGDTNLNEGLSINTQTASSQVLGFDCNGCWASSVSGGNGFRIANTGGGVVDGLTFTGFRAMTNSGNAVLVDGGTNIRFTDGMACSYGAAGFSASSGVSNFTVTNSTLRPDCSGRPPSGQYGVFLGGSNANVTLDNLDTRGNTVAQVAGVPSGNSFVRGITDLLNNASTLASAATISLNIVQDSWAVSGTTPVTTINGGWNQRVVSIFSSTGTVAYNTGGNICNAVSVPQVNTVIARYTGTCWLMK